jgi:hypothetical protein
MLDAHNWVEPIVGRSCPVHLFSGWTCNAAGRLVQQCLLALSLATGARFRSPAG